MSDPINIVGDMGATTFSNKKAPEITMESLLATQRDFMRTLAGEPNGEVKVGGFMPEGCWAVTTPRSVYLMTPRGPISWKTDDFGRVIETNPPNLEKRVQEALAQLHIEGTLRR